MRIAHARGPAGGVFGGESFEEGEVGVFGGIVVTHAQPQFHSWSSAGHTIAAAPSSVIAAGARWGAARGMSQQGGGVARRGCGSGSVRLAIHSVAFGPPGAAEFGDRDGCWRTIRGANWGDLGGVGAVVGAAAGAPRAEAAERRDRAVRRHGIRQLRLLRVVDRDAEPRRAGGGRAALLELPRDAAVLADAGVAADGSQPPRGGDADDRQLPRRRVPEHARGGDEARGDAGGDAAGGGLRDLRAGQVAPESGGGELGGRAL